MPSRLDRVVKWGVLAQKARYQPQELAALCDVSVRQLQRYIKRTFHLTPERWLNRIRLSKAKELLAEGKPVKETAYILDFKNISHFCRQFKHHIGTTPRSFRMKCRQNPARNRS